jgi:glutamate/tyrosine decarboxylase-like PLP-dependent enzyme
MFGFSTGEDSEPCAWGHLTSGGTVANYEALWSLRSVKFYGVALHAAARSTGTRTGPVGPLGKPLEEYSQWELLNLSVDQTIALRREVAEAVRARGGAEAFDRLAAAVAGERIESKGVADFYRTHGQIKPPVVLVPVSAHYSWEKGMKLLGLGKANLLGVGVDDHMRMDPAHLRRLIEEAFADRRPVLAVVGVLGSTEFGTVDPIHEIVNLRDEMRGRRLDFPIHVDAAWGGYLASVFRDASGGLVAREEVAASFKYFPSAPLYDAFAALPRVDSVTVDPHKLGYVPYAAGAYVARNREAVDFITQDAAYVFDVEDGGEEQPRGQRLMNLGRYILEGSKAGAAAAAVHVTHRTLPLDQTGFGRLLAQTVRTCEYFWDTARERADDLADRVRVCVPFEPDSNLICIAVNPTGNRDLGKMNRFGRAVFSRMKVDPDQPVQVKSFIGSYTSLRKESLPGDRSEGLLGALGIDPTTFTETPADPSRESDHIFILRHTLMNPWLMDGPGGRPYVDLYWEYLSRVFDEVLAEVPAGRD